MSVPAAVDGRKLRVVVVGLGDISALHLDAIAGDERADLVAVCDVDGGRAASIGAARGAPAYTDLAAVLVAERPDVAHICTPHHLHAPMAIACLRAGVNVLLEKPVATTVADAQAVIRAARSSTAQVGVCFQNRYNATSLAIQSLLERGDLGRLLGGRGSVTWFRDEAYYRRSPWRGSWAHGGGGVLINQALHTLDLLQWFLGVPTDVHGHADRWWLTDPVEVEDTAAIQLFHPGGARSVFHATNGYVANAPVQLDLIGEKGSLRMDTDLTVTYADGRKIVVAESVLGHGEKAYWGAAHAVLIADFYRKVLAGQPFWIDAAEALHSLAIVSAVYARSPQLRMPR